MKNAKVVHLTSVHGPFDDRIFSKEAKSLARAGYNVTVIAPHTRDDFADGVHVKAVPKSNGRLSRMSLTAWNVYREAMKQHGDVYHFHDPELIPVGLLLRAHGKKVIYDIHEDVPSTILHKDYLSRWLRRPLAWFFEQAENLACRFFSVLTPATPAIAERFGPLNRNTVVLHNYAVLQEFAHESTIAWCKRSWSVAYIGSITRSRGIREVVHAMDILPPGLGASLKLAGPYWPLSLRDELSHLPGWKRVETLGVLNRAGVAELLSNVRAGLLLLYPEPNYLRSKPIKLFEYMSAGIPVIASDFPLWRDIIETAGCGLLVDPLDPPAIAHAIEYILTHPVEAEAMGRCGRRAVEEQYNWPIEELKLLDCYSRLRDEAPLMGLPADD